MKKEGLVFYLGAFIAFGALFAPEQFVLWGLGLGLIVMTVAAYLSKYSYLDEDLTSEALTRLPGIKDLGEHKDCELRVRKSKIPPQYTISYIDPRTQEDVVSVSAVGFEEAITRLENLIENA